jgi:hypothetical protein
MYYVSNYYIDADAFGSFFGVWFIPIGLTFLLPVYVTTIVMEKQERLLEMMKIVRNFCVQILTTFLDGNDDGLILWCQLPFLLYIVCTRDTFDYDHRTGIWCVLLHSSGASKLSCISNVSMGDFVAAYLTSCCSFSGDTHRSLWLLRGVLYSTNNVLLWLWATLWFSSRELAPFVSTFSCLHPRSQALDICGTLHLLLLEEFVSLR